MKKVALVTGTSSGLGLYTAVLLAKKGYSVYASMRDTSKSDVLLTEAQTEMVIVHVVQLDVTDQQSISDCIEAIIKKEGQIDLLVNNAGAGFAKSTEQASLEEIEWVTDVNYTSVVRCTKAVLPFMREKKHGHIINITSVGGLVGQPFNELYCGAKFAVEGYTEGLASYVTSSFGINFSLVEPGGIATQFMKSATEKSMVDGQLIQDDYTPIINKYLATSQKRIKEGKEKAYQTPQEVAEVVVKVALTPKPPLRIRTSEWAETLCELKTMADPDGNRLVNKVKKQFLGE